MSDTLTPMREDLEACARLRALLDRFSYKPGWTFRVEDPPTVWERGLLVVEFTALDARRRGRTRQTVRVRAELRIPPLEQVDQHPDALRDWLWTMLLGMEQHEAGEWFVLDGCRPYDPHREGGPSG